MQLRIQRTQQRVRKRRMPRKRRMRQKRRMQLKRRMPPPLRVQSLPRSLSLVRKIFQKRSRRGKEEKSQETQEEISQFPRKWKWKGLRCTTWATSTSREEKITSRAKSRGTVQDKNESCRGSKNQS